jgi:hypothetical protein
MVMRPSASRPSTASASGWTGASDAYEWDQDLTIVAANLLIISDRTQVTAHRRSVSFCRSPRGPMLETPVAQAFPPSWLPQGSCLEALGKPRMVVPWLDERRVSATTHPVWQRHGPAVLLIERLLAGTMRNPVTGCATGEDWALPDRGQPL